MTRIDICVITENVSVKAMSVMGTRNVPTVLMKRTVSVLLISSNARSRENVSSKGNYVMVLMTARILATNKIVVSCKELKDQDVRWRHYSGSILTFRLMKL